MSEPNSFPYETPLDILYGPLEVIDEKTLAESCEFKWWNQTLCRVNGSVVRMAVVEGEYHWHTHDDDDEFFYVVESSLLIDLEGRTIELNPRQGLVVPCGCSRREFLAGAPHPGEEGPVYPGTCRDGLPPGRRARALRLRVPSAALAFVDGVYGPVEQRLADAVGDFVLRRADGLFAYQLAVVVDEPRVNGTARIRPAAIEKER